MKQTIVFMLCALAFQSLLHAQDSDSAGRRDISVAPLTITMEQAVDAALRNNYGIIADSLEIAVQSANLVQARLPENPEFVLESEDIGLSLGGLASGTQYSLRLEQSFHPTARLKRSKVAGTEVGVARAAFAKRKRDLVAEVKSRFIQALALQHSLALSDSLVAISGKAHDVSVYQAQAGKVSFSDTLKTAAELALALIHRDRDRRDILNAYLELAALWGADKADFACKGDELDTLIEPTDTAAGRIEASSSPENRIWDAEVEKKHALLAFEKALRIPSLRVGAGFGATQGAGGISPRVELSIAVPVLNWNQGAVKAARHGLSQAEFMRREKQNQIRKDILNTYRTAVQVFREAGIIKIRVLPSLSESFQASYLAYTSGKTGILTLIDAQRNFFEASRNSLETVAQYQLTLIELERITGTPVIAKNAQ